MIKKLLLGALILIALVGLPLTVYFAQQRQNTQSKASGSTALYILPQSSSFSPIVKSIGDNVALDIMVDPGTHAVSILKLHLKYDPTKFQGTGSPFIPHPSVFPTVIEGPINDLNGGNIYITISVGSDPTKAVRSFPAKVGTLNLKAIQTTNNQPTVVSFGAVSAAYSVASGDEASQNVLGSLSAGYILIEPLPSTTPSPTPEPSNTPTPTSTPTPSATPTPTASPTPSPQDLRLGLTFYLHSIGQSGDNVNPNSSMSNKNPVRLFRPITLNIYNASNQLITTKESTALYNSETGNFKTTISLGTNFTPGNYIVKVKTDSFLQKRIGVLTVEPFMGQVTLPTVSLIAGDIVPDNTTNILDYNLLIGCYSDFLPAVACDNSKKVMSDLNDDSSVNQFDYNLLLREISVQSGD